MVILGLMLFSLKISLIGVLSLISNLKVLYKKCNFLLFITSNIISGILIFLTIKRMIAIQTGQFSSNGRKNLLPLETINSIFIICDDIFNLEPL